MADLFVVIRGSSVRQVSLVFITAFYPVLFLWKSENTERLIFQTRSKNFIKASVFQSFISRMLKH